MELKYLNELINDNKSLNEDMLKHLSGALEDKKRIENNQKKILSEIFVKVPKKLKLTELEKIIYYFNRIEKVPLTVIADSLGYDRQYITKLSCLLSKKIKSSKNSNK